MPTSPSDCLSQIDSLLSCSRQAWLLGAGVSIGANIPLMGALTARVTSMLAGTPAGNLLEQVRLELPASSHIEHILSQLGDYAAIADRSQRDANIGGLTVTLGELSNYHNEILRAIGETIRWGYSAGDGTRAEKIGKYDAPLVEVEGHANFIRALLGKSQAGISERRHPIRFYTTNYDTLIEDALSLESYPFWDGFSGGAVAFRNYRYGDTEPDESIRAHVIKLHGSIDWHLGADGKVWRVRDMDLYPKRTGRVLIYPQSTKYLATQRDPFAAQFDLLRRALSSRSENVLAICGYSFGDEHINQEIELAMHHPDNKTTIVAFSGQVTPLLESWRKCEWGKKLYLVTASGLHVGNEGPFFNTAPLDWWTFAGVTRLLNNGAESFVI